MTAIKISSCSAIMVSSCHCTGSGAKVQLYWNVLHSDEETVGVDNISTVINVWQKSHCHVVILLSACMAVSC